MGCNNCNQDNVGANTMDPPKDGMSTVGKAISADYEGHFFFKLITFCVLLIALPFIGVVVIIQVFLSFFLPKQLPTIREFFGESVNWLYERWQAKKVKKAEKKRKEQFDSNESYERWYQSNFKKPSPLYDKDVEVAEVIDVVDISHHKETQDDVDMSDIETYEETPEDVNQAWIDGHTQYINQIYTDNTVGYIPEIHPDVSIEIMITTTEKLLSLFGDTIHPHRKTLLKNTLSEAKVIFEKYMDLKKSHLSIDTTEVDKVREKLHKAMYMKDNNDYFITPKD